MWGLSGLKNGLVASSRSIRVGDVGCPAATICSTSFARFWSSSFSGSIVKANLALDNVYSCPKVDLCRRWQGHDLFKRLPHRLDGASIDPSAADGEQNITDESHVGGRNPVDDVTRGVARTVENVDLE